LNSERLNKLLFINHIFLILVYNLCGLYQDSLLFEYGVKSREKDSSNYSYLSRKNFEGPDFRPFFL